MLQWFKDAALTLPITPLTPKWASVPLKGATKTTSVWLGDAYTSLVSQAVGVGDTTINLAQSDELPTTGTVVIGTEQITYTGVTPTPSSSITGCTRGANGTIAATHTVGTLVFPKITYTSGVNITVLISGMAQSPIILSLARPSRTFGPPGVPLLLPVSTVISGVAGAVQVNLQYAAPAGLEVQYTNLSLTTTPVTRPGDVATGFATITLQPIASLYVEQRDQGLAQRLRLLPVTRKVNNDLPGFDWGSYRWRDNTTENAVAIVPTRWDIDTSLITQDFIGGVGSIGETNDLEPIRLEEKQSSIFLRSLRGQYFTGVKRYYLPSGNFNLEFISCYPGQPTQIQLLKPPSPQTPVFVGRWRLDSQGFYEYDLNARYRFPGSFDPLSTQPQFMVDRSTGILTVNPAAQLPQATILMGTLTGGVQEFFDIPYYPIDKIVNMYTGSPTVVISNYVFDRENGTVTFQKIPGTSSGQPLFAVVDAAIAVLYEYDVADNTFIQNINIPDEQDLFKNTRLLTPDLNPAFSGLASGHIYLQHRVLKPIAVTLSADKPQIAIPPTLSSIIGLIAYGPIFYNGDHALLTATAVGSLPNEVVPGAQLQVVPGGFNPLTGLAEQSTPFRGLINGVDPNITPVIVITGGDGIANLVYQPEPNFGFYIPTSAPWVTATTALTPTALTWTSGVGKLTFTLPVSHKFASGTSFRLSGFTPAAWNGDWAVTAIDKVLGTVSFAVPTNPGTVTVIGTASPLDTLLLPVPVPISQLWAGPPNNEGWLDFMYSVLSNDPLFGLSTYLLTGNASISAGVATAQVTALPVLTLQPGNSVTIANATSSVLNGTWTLLTAVLAAGVWTITFNNPNGPLTSTAQTAGTLITTGALPFVTNGTVNGNDTITNAAWTGGVATFTLAAAPTNLTVGQNIDILGCTTSTLNGLQNVLSIFQVLGVWKITTPTSTGGTGSEAEGAASFKYSNFRSNGVLAAWNKSTGLWAANATYQVGDEILDSNGVIEIVTSISGTGTSASVAPTWSTTFGNSTTDNPGANQIVWKNVGKPGPSASIPIHAFDKNGNDYTAGGFDGNVVQLVFNTGLPNPSQGFVQAYLLQFLEREIIQLQVVGTNIYSNSIMLQMQTPQQILNNPYLVLSTDQTTTPPYYANASANSRFNINRLGITPTTPGAG